MKQKSINKTRNAFSGILVATGLLLLAGCAGEVYTSGGGGVAYYDYDYYPSADIYYYPHDRVYYWNDGGHWHSGRNIPHHYELHEQDREHLQLHTHQPWTEHRPEHQEFQGHYPGNR